MYKRQYKDGEYIKNKVFNQYQPDGYVTDAWCTNLNPQDDIWSKDISVQSDLLTLTYKDDSKLDYYGSNAVSYTHLHFNKWQNTLPKDI